MASTSKKASSENGYNFTDFRNSLIADDSIEWQHILPFGIRFNPDDQVLVSHYLAGKVSGSTDGPIFSLIKEVDVYKHDPSALSSLAYNFSKGKMYFFTRLNKETKVPVPGGYWEKIREPSFVKSKDGNPIGLKKTRVYYKNDHQFNPVKTQRHMKEYMLLDNQPSKQNVEESCVFGVVYNSRRQCESLKMNDDDENNSCSESDMSSSDSE